MKGLAFMVVSVAVAAAVYALATLAGLGNASILAVVEALFFIIATVGGTAAGDLRMLAWLGPSLVFAGGVPRLLAEWSPWAAIPLVGVIVFISGLLPALGARFRTAGLGLGLTAVFGYGFQIDGEVSATHVLAAPTVAIAFAAALRVLCGAALILCLGGDHRPALANALTTNGNPADQSTLTDSQQLLLDIIATSLTNLRRSATTAGTR